jgi:hypothetical protein
MMKLEEPSVEQARCKVEERLSRMKLREDIAHSARNDRDQSHRLEAQKTAQLRALRLAKIAAENCLSRRQSSKTRVSRETPRGSGGST